MSEKKVLYNIAIWANNTESSRTKTYPLYDPMVNISLTGNIPTKPSTFKLSLPCTGLLNAEVDVILNINVTSPRPEVSPTVLYFRRRKICMK
ncbi:Tyrosine-protein kinase Drl, partial [Armadillidium vulgare]